MNNRFGLAVLICLTGGFASGISIAQEQDCRQIESSAESAGLGYEVVLKTLVTAKCLGGAKDKDEIVINTIKLIPVVKDKVKEEQVEEVAMSGQERLLHSQAAMDYLTTNITNTYKKYKEVNSVAKEELWIVLLGANKINEYLGSNGQNTPVIYSESWEGVQYNKFWYLDRDQLKYHKLPDVDVGTGILDNACAGDPSSETCKSAYNSAQEVIRFAKLIERVLSYYNTPIIEAGYEDAVRRDNQWDAYFDDAIFQYWWELKANGYLMDRYDDREKDEHGNKLGFRKPPNWQVIALHPRVAYEYVSNADSGTSLAVVPALDIVGYNRWKWKPDGTMGRALGGSIIATVSSRSGTDNYGIGAMVHINNDYSFAITTHGGDVGFLVTMNVAQFLFDVKPKYRNALRFD